MLISDNHYLKVYNKEALRSTMVFQEHGLFPRMNVPDNAAFRPEMQGQESRAIKSKHLSF
jgi:ABC-type proline/glycine betaine transport system ATPase subunit